MYLQFLIEMLVFQVYEKVGIRKHLNMQSFFVRSEVIQLGKTVPLGFFLSRK